jgi:hypothetical protein
MPLTDRIGHAAVNALFGALLGVVCWWLYGLAHSLNYDGPAMDPVLRHWVLWLAAIFALLGFFFGARAGEFMVDAWDAVIHFELNDAPGKGANLALSLAFLAILIAVLWFTVPGKNARPASATSYQQNSTASAAPSPAAPPARGTPARPAG